MPDTVSVDTVLKAELVLDNGVSSNDNGEFFALCFIHSTDEKAVIDS